MKNRRKALEALTELREQLQTEFADAVNGINTTTPPPKPKAPQIEVREEQLSPKALRMHRHFVTS